MAPQTEDRLTDHVWQPADVIEYIGAKAESLLNSLNKTQCIPIIQVTYTKQIVVHFLSVVVFFAVHAHEQIFHIDNGAEQFIDLFVGNVAQMRYMVF